MYLDIEHPADIAPGARLTTLLAYSSLEKLSIEVIGARNGYIDTESCLFLSSWPRVKTLTASILPESGNLGGSVDCYILYKNIISGRSASKILKAFRGVRDTEPLPSLVRSLYYITENLNGVFVGLTFGDKKWVDYLNHKVIFK